MHEVPNTATIPTTDAGKKPGYRLRMAREAKQLSQEQVAASLYLTVTQIDAIERDDYSYVPAVVYARGHITLYARYLGLPLADILQEFAQLQTAQSVAAAPQLKTEPLALQDIAIKRSWLTTKKAAWLIIGLVVIAVLLLLIWLAGQHENQQKPRNTLLVAPGDAGNVSQFNDNSIALPVPLDAEQKPTAGSVEGDTKKDNPPKSAKPEHVKP